jgi:hypothetical protein
VGVGVLGNRGWGVLGNRLVLGSRLVLGQPWLLYLQYYIDAAKVDISLTCCIAISFAFDGLISLKLMSERSYSTV